mgnify:CR=1 FL=1
MQELSRVYLYGMVLNELEEVTRDKWYYQGEISEIMKVLKTNIYMLEGIENQFVLGRETELLEEEIVKQQIMEKIERFEDVDFREFLNRPRRKIPNKNEYVMSFFDYLYQKEKHWDVVTLFSKLLDELHEYSEKRLKGIEKNVFSEIFNIFFTYPAPETKVFLSYAYKDKLYSWVLYHYMRKKSVLLYVDWMHSDALGDGAEIKTNLQKALSDSEQFLFLRTSNSELGKSDTKQIRSWCSWEFGNFYGPTSKGLVDRAEEKYYIQVYSDLNKKRTRKKAAVPTIIDGLKRLSDIKQGRLVGLLL